MNDKYIIKNCPAKYFVGASNMKCSEFGGDCQDCTDCKLKQIVELCKNIKSINKTNSYVGEYIEFTQRSPLADEILELLDIDKLKDEERENK